MAFLPSPTEAGVLGQLLRGRAAGGVSRAAERSVGRDVARTLARDRARDAERAVSHVNQARTVQRYTSEQQAASYLKRGVPAGTHFTSKATPGLPFPLIERLPDTGCRLSLKSESACSFRRVLR